MQKSDNDNKTLISISHLLFFSDDKSTYLKAVLRLNDHKFNASLKNLLSEESKTLADWLEDGMKDLFGDVIRGANVVGFRYGHIFILRAKFSMSCYFWQ